MSILLGEKLLAFRSYDRSKLFTLNCTITTLWSRQDLSQSLRAALQLFTGVP
jgi:hypothetical protein